MLFGICANGSDARSLPHSEIVFLAAQVCTAMIARVTRRTIGQRVQRSVYSFDAALTNAYGPNSSVQTRFLCELENLS